MQHILLFKIHLIELFLEITLMFNYYLALHMVFIVDFNEKLKNT